MSKRTLRLEVTYDDRKVDAEYVVSEIGGIPGVVEVREADQEGENE